MKLLSVVVVLVMSVSFVWCCVVRLLYGQLYRLSQHRQDLSPTKLKRKNTEDQIFV